MRRGLIGLGLVALLAAACGKQPELGAPPLPGVFEARAEQIAQAWRTADIDDAFVPMQDLTIAPKDGFPTGELKQAFLAGFVSTDITLPTEAGTGTIKFSDGTLSVPTLSADKAYQLFDKGDAPAGQANLVVTEAKSGTTTMYTSRGMAEVPVWSFTVKDIDHPVVLVAVAPQAIKQLPTQPLDPPDARGNLVSSQDLTAVDGDTIDYRLGVGACDEAITALVWESADIIVIGGSVRYSGEMCTSQLVLFPVKVTLKAPVGDRVILDAVTGSPIRLQQPR